MLILMLMLVLRDLVSNRIVVLSKNRHIYRPYTMRDYIEFTYWIAFRGQTYDLLFHYAGNMISIQCSLGLMLSKYHQWHIILKQAIIPDFDITIQPLEQFHFPKFNMILSLASLLLAVLYSVNAITITGYVSIPCYPTSTVVNVCPGISNVSP